MQYSSLLASERVDKGLPWHPRFTDNPNEARRGVNGFGSFCRINVVPFGTHHAIGPRPQGRTIHKNYLNSLKMDSEFS